MSGLIGSLDLTFLVPNTYRASTSLVLQTAFIIGAIFAVFKLISFIRYRRNVERIFGNLPGPKERHWLYGSFIAFRTLDPQQGLYKFLEWGNKYSKERGYVRVWSRLGEAIIITCTPSSMRRILKTAEPKPLNSSSNYRTLRDWLGDGLLISGGEKWARNRRLLTPAFHFDILKPYIDVYNDSANILVEKLGKLADEKKEFEIFQHICPCTLDIILRCAFSYDIDVQRSGETHPYVQAVNDLATATSQRARNPFLTPDIIFYRTKLGKKYKQDCDFVHGVAEDIINKRRRTLEKLGDLKPKKYLDFMDILLTAKDENGTGLSDMDIRNEVDTFLFEGHDTTASAISWILYSLAKHPEYQQKCQEEIDDLLEGRETDDIKWSDLSQLEYLSMCIKEGMRMHSPVAIVARQTTKPFDLGDTVVPAGTNIMDENVNLLLPLSCGYENPTLGLRYIQKHGRASFFDKSQHRVNILMLHHNEHVWGKDHMEYKPERFTKDNVAKMDPYQFVPFSGGSRNCIGQNFAMNEEKVVLAKLLHNFTFSLKPDHEVKWRLSAVMRSQDGIMATVRRRQH